MKLDDVLDEFLNKDIPYLTGTSNQKVYPRNEYQRLHCQQLKWFKPVYVEPTFEKVAHYIAEYEQDIKALCISHHSKRKTYTREIAYYFRNQDRFILTPAELRFDSTNDLHHILVSDLDIKFSNKVLNRLIEMSGTKRIKRIAYEYPSAEDVYIYNPTYKKHYTVYYDDEFSISLKTFHDYNPKCHMAERFIQGVDLFTGRIVNLFNNHAFIERKALLDVNTGYRVELTELINSDKYYASYRNIIAPEDLYATSQSGTT